MKRKAIAISAVGARLIVGQTVQVLPALILDDRAALPQAEPVENPPFLIGWPSLNPGASMPLMRMWRNW